MFFYRSTIEIDGFSMVFPNSGAIVSDGFDLDKDLKMPIIMTYPLLRQLCLLFKDKDKDKECFISIRDIPEFR